MGCQSIHWNRVPEPPNTVEFQRDQLVIHSDVQLPRKHRLFEDLERRRRDLTEELLLPPSDELIHVYLFADQNDFARYVRKVAGEFQDRRAFFIKSDTELNVFGYWGDRVAEDLRHEVTHAYLHSVVDNLPLWLDEGIAEYYEVDRAAQGLNQRHLYLLSNDFRSGKWQPNLERLELFQDPVDFQQREYAESWLWVHFLMNHSADSRRLIPDALARLRMSGETPRLSKEIEELIPEATLELVKHLKQLAEKQ